jgi:hypothetical protein
MHLNTDPISEIDRGAVFASVRARRESTFQMQSLEIRLMVFAVASTLLAFLLVSFLVGSIVSGVRADLGLWMLAIVLFVPAILAVGFIVSLRKPGSYFELREGGVLVSSNVFILWREIASVNFEGTLPSLINSASALSSAPRKAVRIRLRYNSDSHADMTLGFVLSDCDAIIRRGPAEGSQNLVAPFGDTPGQAVVSFDYQITLEEYSTLLDVTRTVTQQRGIPFRRHTTATEKLQREEYRAGQSHPTLGRPGTDPTEG